MIKGVLPSNKSVDEQVLREAVNDLLNGNNRAVRGDDMTSSGIFEYDPAGRLRIGKVVQNMQGQLLGAESRISGFTTGLQEIKSTFELTNQGLLAQTREVTELRTHVEILRLRGDQIESRIIADANANRELLSRVTANDRMIEVLARDQVSLQSQLAIGEGTLSFMGNEVIANAEATQTLETKITATDERVDAMAQLITDLSASINVLPRVFLQSNEPDPDEQGPFIVGDMWLKSDDGNKVHVWDGMVWSQSMDLVGATVYAQTEPPVGAGLRVGDLWFDLDNNNRQHRWNGVQWEDVTNPIIDATAAATQQLRSDVTLMQGSISANSQSITTLTTQIAGKADQTALSDLSARVTTTENLITSQGNSITSLQGQIANKAEASAVQQLTTRMTAAEGTITSLSTAMTSVQASLPGLLSPSPNLLTNPTFASGSGSWSVPAPPASEVVLTGVNGPYLVVRPVGANASNYVFQDVSMGPGQQIWLSAEVFLAPGSGSAVLYVEAFNASNQLLVSVPTPVTGAAYTWLPHKVGTVTPAGTAYVRAVMAVTGTNADVSLRRVKLERNAVSTPYSDERQPVVTAQAITSLNASVTNINGQLTSQSTALTNVQAGLESNRAPPPNMLLNSTWADNGSWWAVPAGTVFLSDSSSGPFMNMPASSGGGISATQNVATSYGSRRFWFSADVYLNDSAGTARVEIIGRNSGTSVAANTIAAVPTIIGRWQRVSVWMDAPAIDQIIVRVISEGKNGTTSWRNAKLEMGDYATSWNNSRDYNALATATNTLSATVSNHEGRITAQGNSITSITATLPGKADASVVQTLTATVSTIGGGNLLKRSIFGNGTNPWATGAVAGNWTRDDTSFQDFRLPKGMRSMTLYSPPGQAQPEHYLQTYQDIPVEWYKTYIASAYLLPYGLRAYSSVIFLDYAGNALAGGADGNQATLYNAASTLKDYTRSVAKAQAPYGAVTARMSIWVVKTAQTAADAACWVVQPMFEEARPDQTTASVWSAGGAESSAEWKVTVNANGKLAGIRAGVDGTIAAVDILASMFRISAEPGAAMRTEYSDGNWRAYAPNGVMVVQMGYWA